MLMSFAAPCTLLCQAHVAERATAAGAADGLGPYPKVWSGRAIKSALEWVVFHSSASSGRGDSAALSRSLGDTFQLAAHISPLTNCGEEDGTRTRRKEGKALALALAQAVREVTAQEPLAPIWASRPSIAKNYGGS